LHEPGGRPLVYEELKTVRIPIETAILDDPVCLPGNIADEILVAQSSIVPFRRYVAAVTT
jgi:hypothetical protein